MNYCAGLVERFHECFGHPINTRVVPMEYLKKQIFTLGNGKQMTGEEILKARLAFMQEELDEFKESIDTNDTAGAVDDMLDLLVFALGTLLIQGVRYPERLFSKIMEANMDKAPICENCRGEGELKYLHSSPPYKESCTHCGGTGRIVSYDPVTGKVQKRVGWEHPDVKSLIEDYNQTVSADL